VKKKATSQEEMPPKADQIAGRIRKRREEAGLSLGQLAEDADVSKSYLWRLESGSGQVRPSGKTLYRIAGALGTTMSDLLGREVLVDAPEDFPPSLIKFAQRNHLTPREQRMLAQIEFRGRRPQTMEDWEFLWNAIERSVPARRPRTGRKPVRRKDQGRG
jgi:transcriptional regulator with XRE-family HTH domain